MKALSLWQPWASLLACGAKRYETRSWATNYRGPMAIHASKKLFDTGTYLDRELHPFADALGLPDIYSFDTLPRGCVIATADLLECYQVIPNTLKCADGNYRLNLTRNGGRGTATYAFVPKDELLFGDFSYGRYIWEFANVKLLTAPAPAKGAQGLWNWEEAARNE